MTITRWDQHLRIGIPEIDKQHEEIIKSINHLHDVVKVRNKRSIIKAYDALVYCIFQNLDYEEQIMNKCNYCDCKLHRKFHDEFMKFVFDMYEKIKYATDIRVVINIIPLVLSWVFDHILIDDKHAFAEIKAQYSV